MPEDERLDERVTTKHPWRITWRVAFGWLAAGVWLFLFSAGILIDSLPYRIKLGWLPSDAGGIERKIQVIDDRVERLEEAKNRAGKDSSPVNEVTGSAKPTTGDDRAEGKSGRLNKANCSMTTAFLIASLTYLPVNLALLCLVAAFLGGCSVSDQIIHDVSSDVKRFKDGPKEFSMRSRLNFLTEHPGFSALRGIVVFLLLISGLFAFGGTETLISNPEQINGLGRYMRLAGIFSIISYLAGHDPSILTSLLRFSTGRLNGDGGSGSNQGSQPNPTPYPLPSNPDPKSGK